MKTQPDVIPGIITAEIIVKSIVQLYFDQGLSQRKIASIMGLSQHQIRKHVKRLNDDKNELLVHIKKNMSDDLMLSAHKFLNIAQQPGKMEKASLLQAMTGAGIAIDKARLLQDQSTQNLSVRASVEKLTSAEDVLEQLLQERRVGSGGTGDPYGTSAIKVPPHSEKQKTPREVQEELKRSQQERQNSIDIGSLQITEREKVSLKGIVSGRYSVAKETKDLKRVAPEGNAEISQIIRKRKIVNRIKKNPQENRD